MVNVLFNIFHLLLFKKKKKKSEYLALFGKSLDPSQLQQICLASQTQNPLFLRAMLEELRLHGVYEEINKKIEHYLKASSVSQLYELILQRLEKVSLFLIRVNIISLICLV